MADISNNYSVTLQATIAKITQAELDKAVAGLKLKIKTELDTTGVQNQVNNAITKATTSGKGKSIIPTQPTIDALGVIQNRINEIKKSGGTTPDTAVFKNSANEINKATLDYADALGIAKTETFSLVDANGKITKNMSDAVGFTRQLTKETTKVSDVNNNLANTLASNAKKVAEWAISTALIYGTIHQIRKAMEYISELNKEMTSIQMVTGMSPSEVNKLSTDYNKLASELGSTTLEISKGSLEWFRQGKTVEEVSELMRSTMMMSKLGNIDSAQSTEYLTSTLNGFKLEAKDAISVVDKLTALDNNYATSVAEIASALQRSSNSAQQAGVTFDELASYITVVSSTTRKSAESIGESFPR